MLVVPTQSYWNIVHGQIQHYCKHDLSFDILHKITEAISQHFCDLRHQLSCHTFLITWKRIDQLDLFCTVSLYRKHGDLRKETKVSLRIRSHFAFETDETMKVSFVGAFLYINQLLLLSCSTEHLIDSHMHFVYCHWATMVMRWTAWTIEDYVLSSNVPSLSTFFLRQPTEGRGILSINSESYFMNNNGSLNVWRWI